MADQTIKIDNDWTTFDATDHFIAPISTECLFHCVFIAFRSYDG